MIVERKKLISQALKWALRLAYCPMMVRNTLKSKTNHPKKLSS
jgi:hypothetical protein